MTELKKWYLYTKDNSEIDCSEEVEAETRKEAVQKFIELLKQKTNKDYPVELIEKSVLLVL
jgi:hypothetical protein